MPLRLLADLRVVEIASGTTEFAGHLLAGLGAEVLLVEPPGGAETRARRPFAAARDPSRRSIPFLARNHGKRSIVLEPADAGDRERLTALVATAEVLLAPHGSPFDPLPAPGARCTQVVVRDDEGIGAASVTAFAASGGLAASGWPDRAPCNSPSWLAQDSAGTYAACFALVGAWLVRRGAPAPRFEVPLREAAIAGLTPWTRAMRSYAAAANAPARPARLGPSLHPYLPAADGYVRAPVPTPAQFDALVELVGGPDELRRPPWTERAFRTQNIDALVMLIEDRTRARTRADLVDGGQRLGLTITPVLTPAEVMADAHVRARGLFVEVDDPDLGRVPLMREAVRLPLEPAPPPPVPAPALDADAALA
ncbi:MAG: hypothetical protein FJZ92_09690, partial [Chloroflexi bacterium]|nr:hypothetical protein [Chloroflexota bacterium]